MQKAMVIDDSRAIRTIISRTLTQLGYEVSQAANGEEGLQALESASGEVSLVLVDWNMPIMNGLDVLRQIVRHRPQTKVLAFSVHDSKQIVEEILAAGAHSYLSKATAGQHLVHKVRTLLNGQAQSQHA